MLANRPEVESADELTKSALLVTVLFSDAFPDEALLRWGRSIGYDLNRRHRVALISPGPTDDQELCHFRLVWNHLGVMLKYPEPLVADGPEGIICLCPDFEGWEPSRWRSLWQRLFTGLGDRSLRCVALGAAACDPRGLRSSFRQAHLLAYLQQLRRQPFPVSPIAIFGDSGLADLLIDNLHPEHILPYLERVLGPLMNQGRFGGELVQTLHAYLATDGSPKQAAKLLHVHPSSVKYRMRFIRELVGAPRLENPNDRFELELAVRLFTAVSQIEAAPLPPHAGLEVVR